MTRIPCPTNPIRAPSTIVETQAGITLGVSAAAATKVAVGDGDPDLPAPTVDEDAGAAAALEEPGAPGDAIWVPDADATAPAVAAGARCASSATEVLTQFVN